MDQLYSFLKDTSSTLEALSTFAAAIAAFCSLLVAGLAIRQQKGAVRPLPFIEINDYANDVAVSLRNFGVGPLTITELIVTENPSGVTKGNVIDFMPPLEGHAEWTTFVSTDIVGRPIAPGEEMRLVQYCGDNEGDIKRIRTALSRLTVTAKTKDVFDRTMKPCTRNLVWFARY
jgi:hypothetical protein